MTISKMCQECIEHTTKECRGVRSDVVPAGHKPCRSYELDPQLISDQDIEPDSKPPSLKDHKPDKTKPLVPDAVLITNKVKADAFKRLAMQRLVKTLDDIRKLGNLSSKASYEWDSEQIDAIVSRIMRAASDLGKKFQKK